MCDAYDVPLSISVMNTEVLRGNLIKSRRLNYISSSSRLCFVGETEDLIYVRITPRYFRDIFQTAGIS